MYPLCAWRRVPTSSGGQPISFANMQAATDICRRHGVLTVLDASLLQDNLYFIKTREKEMQSLSVREITRKIADLFDIIYFSARKFGFARGGAILVRDEELFIPWRTWCPCSRASSPTAVCP